MDVLIVDDHPAYRAGMHALLGHDPNIRSVTEAASVSEALAIAETRTFQLAIVDVVLPETGGASLVRQLRERQPACRTLALSMIDEPIRIAEMLRAGAVGYALKSQPVDDIMPAIHAVLRGERYLPPQMTPVPSVIDGAPLPLDRLTARERTVFDLLVRGLTNRGVADNLMIARRTIDAHRRHIMRKLGARSIVDLIRLAMRSGSIRTI
ncbi:MAG: response regulator transcription factor [Myxococcota bacterium]|nr:response regulator transcription factor [Deltaproteobacteria bacterium]MDQ3336397.1 response regulator transcription factor [Myxococcota bacterium]